ncbi:MAG: hypothetical protein AAB968_03295, partial [Patescibacteria group bacterium]
MLRRPHDSTRITKSVRRGGCERWAEERGRCGGGEGEEESENLGLEEVEGAGLGLGLGLGLG